MRRRNFGIVWSVTSVTFDSLKCKLATKFRKLGYALFKELLTKVWHYLCFRLMTLLTSSRLSVMFVIRKPNYIWEVICFNYSRHACIRCVCYSNFSNPRYLVLATKLHLVKWKRKAIWLIRIQNNVITSFSRQFGDKYTVLHYHRVSFFRCIGNCM